MMVGMVKQYCMYKNNIDAITFLNNSAINNCNCNHIVLMILV